MKQLIERLESDARSGSLFGDDVRKTLSHEAADAIESLVKVNDQNAETILWQAGRIGELTDEIESLRTLFTEADLWRRQNAPVVESLTAERDALRAEIAKMREQKPVGMFFIGPVTGLYQPVHQDRPERVKDYVPLYAAPGAQPAQHDSDCAKHNMPAYPAGPCDCSVSKGAQP